MCELTSLQLAGLLNYLLSVDSFHRLMVESWSVKQVRYPVERWCDNLLLEYSLIPCLPRAEQRRGSLITPPAILRFVSVQGRIELICRQKRRLGATA